MRNLNRSLKAIYASIFTLYPDWDITSSRIAYIQYLESRYYNDIPINEDDWLEFRLLADLQPFNLNI